MDPIHPIVPVTPGIGALSPLPSTRRVNPDSQREPGRRDRRQAPRREPAPHADRPDEAPHIDITA